MPGGMQAAVQDFAGCSPSPKPVALMRVAGVVPFLAFLERTGAPVGRLLGRSRIPEPVLRHAEGLLPVAQVERLMEDAAHERCMDHMGLVAGAATPVESLGVLGRLIARSTTLRDAIDTLTQRAPSFHSGGRWRLAVRGERAQLCHEFDSGCRPPSRQADQFFLMLALNTVRLAAGEWWPDAVRFQTARVSRYRELPILARATVDFDRRETGVTFAAALLDRRLPSRSCRDAGEAIDLERWNASAPANDFADSVLQVTTTLATTSYPRLDVVAGAIGTSVRTLQRRLADAGVTYEQLIARARFDAATHLLTSTDASVLDIALDLGYSDHAHFTRAFRRWTGIPPREFRKHGRDDATDVGAGRR